MSTFESAVIAISTLSLIVTATLAVAAIYNVIKLIEQNKILSKQVKIATDAMKSQRKMMEPGFVVEKGFITSAIERNAKENRMVDYYCSLYVQNIKTIVLPITRLSYDIIGERNMDDMDHETKLYIEEENNDVEIEHYAFPLGNTFIVVATDFLIPPLVRKKICLEVRGEIINCFKKIRICIRSGNWQDDVFNNIPIEIDDL